MSNGYMRKQGTHGNIVSDIGERIGYTTTNFYIPIKRVTGYSKFVFEAKTIKNNGTSASLSPQDFNDLQVRIGAIVNGTMQHAVSAQPTSVHDWTTYIVDISSLPYVDYIGLHGTNGSPAYRNMRFEK